MDMLIILLALALIGLGLLAGGCSVFSTVDVFQGLDEFGSDLVAIWLLGLAVGGGLILAGVVLLKWSRSPPAPPPPPDPKE